jgi:hypothetical protein
MGPEGQQRDQPGDGPGNRQYQTFHLITFLSAAIPLPYPNSRS